MTDQWMSCPSLKTTRSLFSESDCVLLLGEGNFSFAKELSPFCRIIATDLSINDTNDANIEQNCQYLMSCGHEVYRNIDATNLDNCPQLRGREDINHIMFNFPHVFTKKMKIGLNRKLLKDFFISADKYISDRRVKVHVTLCWGQSGVPQVDASHTRKWSDSWQLPEMASYGGFVIVCVTPFDCNYQSFGYRLKNISFNTNNAKTFSFEKRDHLMVSCGKLSQMLTNNKKNLFSNHLVIELINELKTVFNNSVNIECEVDIKSTCFPFIKHWILLDKESDTLSKVNHFFESFENRVFQNQNIIINDILIGFICESFVRLNVENLAELLWNITDSRILWSKYLRFDEQNQQYITGSLFNREHTHDISFWINDHYCYRNVLETVLDVFATILKSIQLIDSYELNSRISKCYRIVYQSVDCALSQQKSNQMQQLLRELLLKRFNLIMR